MTRFNHSFSLSFGIGEEEIYHIGSGVVNPFFQTFFGVIRSSSVIGCI